ncbi:hypothetical protein OA667_03630 [Prochlorococcus sp. AH-716-G10]|nr:hypothetical protein [Prochlorococcus sp. AH-716-G10]
MREKTHHLSLAIMSEVKTQEIDSTQQQQQQQQQSYQDSTIYSAETEQLYLKMKEGWL